MHAARIAIRALAVPCLFPAFVSLLVALFMGSGGCQAIVNGEIPGYSQTCTGTASDACPPGSYCKGAGCTACEARDICDGFDNDCNGKVDDGQLSDHDGDGYSFCGHVDEASGHLLDVDCDDNDATVHPGATETCNGKDDDCDGIVDNPDHVCGPNETCAPRTGCTSNTVACTVVPCPPPQVCDTSSQKCVDTNGDLGTPCKGDKACQSGICGDDSVLGPTVGKGGVCTKPCCRSEDCGTGFVCFGAGTGGNYCVKPDSLGRAKVGTVSGGASCGTGADCRSGACVGGRCLDTCCSDVNCAAGTTCGVASVGGVGTFACVAPTGSVDPNQACARNSDCRSGVCSSYSDGFSTYQRCTAPCCGSTACGAFNVPGPFGSQIPVDRVCFDDKTPAGDGTVPLCVEPKQGSGAGAVGDPCRSGGDCLSDRCASNKLCTDVCCVDADCGRPGWVCRPVQGTFLRCVPAQ